MRFALLTASVLLAAAVGCGAETEADPDPGPAADESPQTELEITFWPQGRSNGNAQTWKLTCEPAGGTHPNPADACARLAAIDDPFAPPPKDELCTEQYGGPEEARVEGTHLGKAVSYGMSRTNGCNIARFDRLRFLLAVSPDA